MIFNMARKRRETPLPLTGRPLPQSAAWVWEESFLIEAGATSIRTETTYRSGLRLFADWLQHFERDQFSTEQEWPLSPQTFTTPTILEFRNWLVANRSRSTVTTYMAAVSGYLNFLDGMDALPDTVRLGKLQRQLSRRRIDRNQAESVIDFDRVRQYIPKLVAYYDQLPLPAENDRYNRRLSLLRNRAIVHTLYSTAARISELISINRRNIDNGRADQAVIIGKGNKARTLYFQDYAKKSLFAYLSERSDSNPAVFVAHSRNAKSARLSITAVHNVVKKGVHALNLHESLSAHDFRHFRATQLLREGMPIEVVQEFLGHSDISTTRNIYAPVLGTKIVSEWLSNFDVTPAEATEKIVNSELND